LKEEAVSIMDAFFRKVSDVSPELKTIRDFSRSDAARRRGSKTKPGGSTLYSWSFMIHKWSGLLGAAWLSVLGLTGFFLDHDSWRSLMQNKAPAWLTTEALERNSSRNIVRLFQIDPNDEAIRIAGGPRGLWHSGDSGRSWIPTDFLDGDHPQILAIEPDPGRGWSRLWFATDNGLYLSEDRGASARPASLQGEYVTALAAGSTRSDMLGVIDKSKVFRFSTDDPARIERIAIAPLASESRPLDVQLNRFLRELHFGKGVFDRLSSLVMNDIGGLAMFVLSLTGLLYWGLPKWWKARARHNSAARVSKSSKKSTVVWLFRIHSATLGIASVLMILYLCVTGIFIGHGRELGDWMRATRIPQGYLTPAFALSSWEGWIDAIIGYPDMPGVFTIGNRLGMFTTIDDGQSFAREEGPEERPVNIAARMRRFGDKILIANGMAGPSVIRGTDQISHEVAVSNSAPRHRGAGTGAMRHAGHEGAGDIRNGREAAAKMGSGARDARGGVRLSNMAGMGGMEGMFMPSDVTRSGDKLFWESSNRLYVTDSEGKEIDTLDMVQPSDPGTPWFNWLLRLHMGTIFWSKWKWVNDAFAVLAVLLSVTGLIRWWRRKWA
jgi:hypothetical protein